MLDDKNYCVYCGFRVWRFWDCKIHYDGQRYHKSCNAREEKLMQDDDW